MVYMHVSITGDSKAHVNLREVTSNFEGFVHVDKDLNNTFNGGGTNKTVISKII